MTARVLDIVDLKSRLHHPARLVVSSTSCSIITSLAACTQAAVQNHLQRRNHLQRHGTLISMHMGCTAPSSCSAWSAAHLLCMLPDSGPLKQFTQLWPCCSVFVEPGVIVLILAANGECVPRASCLYRSGCTASSRPVIICVCRF